MTSTRTLLVATSNAGKIAEIRSMLTAIPIRLAGLSDFQSVIEIPETGTTFRENACLKALGYAHQTGLFALADDSGLEVAALAGRPGVLSARYGGVNLPFDKKLEKLLQEIRATGTRDRSARFVCSIAVASPDGRILKTADGVCNGHICEAPRGSHGFGYDPIFVPTGFKETFGELSENTKSLISHRARAFLQIIPILRDFLV